MSQFLKIAEDATLSSIGEIIGRQNLSSLLAINHIPVVRDVGRAVVALANEIDQTQPDVPWRRKLNILNSLSGDSDVYEHVALGSEQTWKVVSALGTLPGFAALPEGIKLSLTDGVLGNSSPVPKDTAVSIAQQLQGPMHSIDPSTFGRRSAPAAINNASKTLGASTTSADGLYSAFHMPWGDISLYTSITGEHKDFPVYPEQLSESRTANYTTMPDLLYQYEPWQLYQGSGLSTRSYKFDFHRDMWTGDHRDGKARELVRFCQANCYPKYRGSAVQVPIVTLYIAGDTVVSGVMTEANAEWDGPIGLDGWYLHCVLTITIIEVSPYPLNFDSVKNGQ